MRLPRLLLLIPLLVPPVAGAQDSGAEQKSRSTGRVVTHMPDRSTALLVPLSDASKHLAVVVSFPEPVTRALVPWNEEDLSIDSDGSDVMLKLLKPVEGDIAFRGRSGALYRLHVKPAGDQPGDSLVRIIARQEEPAAARVPATAKNGAVELIRAMRLGQLPADARVSAMKGPAVYETGSVVIRPRLLYDTAAHTGHVLEVLNRSKDEPYRVDLSVFAAKNLVLAGARELLLAPGATTRLYLIFWK